MTALLTQHLATWIAADTAEKSGRGRSAEASLYGIKKLRELILELAVRGLLVPQNADDEPASQLLKKIDTELCTITGTKNIPKMHRDKSTTEPSDFHFHIPTNWIWCELQDIAIFENGKAHEQFVNESGDFILVNSRVCRHEILSHIIINLICKAA